MKCALLLANSNISPTILNLPIVNKIDTAFEGYVIVNEQGTSLLVPSIAKTAYQVDFTSGKMAYRHSKISSQQELIVKACKVKGLARPTHILDATAGFGRDAFILAASGAEVTLVERNAIVATLLQDGINRIDSLELKQRLHLINQDSEQLLSELSNSTDKPDVIYLDPMFEEDRNAKVKKDLQMLQWVLQGTIANQQALLPLALKACQSRVVVKRAIHAEPLNKQAPDFSVTGKHSRFDIYLVQR